MAIVFQCDVFAGTIWKVYLDSKKNLTYKSSNIKTMSSSTEYAQIITIFVHDISHNQKYVIN